jgi:hypothetical protein
MASVEFQTGVNFGEGKDVLNPLFVEILDQSIRTSGFESEAQKLGFTMEDLRTPDQKYTSVVGPEPMKKVVEEENSPVTTIRTGYEKGIKPEKYALKVPVSDIFAAWVKQGAQLDRADSSVKAELDKFLSNSERLIKSDLLTRNIEMSKIYTSGFVSTSAFGPGSATPGGQALFSASHPTKAGTTFSNLGSSLALTDTNLAAAIEAMKLFIDDSGYRVRRPKAFTLVVPAEKELTALKLMNSASYNAGQFAGTGSNSNLMNPFFFQNHRVDVVVADLFNQKDGNGVSIGNGTNWFLLNREYLADTRALKVANLFERKLNMWTNEDNGTTYIGIKTMFAVDHVGAEKGMWGTLGS